jgi:predicted butyrate kinase (DUF1464 family)
LLKPQITRSHNRTIAQSHQRQTPKYVKQKRQNANTKPRTKQNKQNNKQGMTSASVGHAVKAVVWRGRPQSESASAAAVVAAAVAGGTEMAPVPVLVQVLVRVPVRVRVRTCPTGR